MLHFFEALSLILSFTTLYLCAETVVVWWPEARKFIKGHRAPWAWAGVAVVLHYGGSFLDGSYWGVAWSFKLATSPLWPGWVATGPIANVPFRQLATGISALCYLRAAMLFTSQMPRLSRIHRRAAWATLAGVAYVSYLYHLRP